MGDGGGISNTTTTPVPTVMLPLPVELCRHW